MAAAMAAGCEGGTVRPVSPLISISGMAETWVDKAGHAHGQALDQDIGNAVPVTAFGDFAAEDEQIAVAVLVQHLVVGPGSEPAAVLSQAKRSDEAQNLLFVVAVADEGVAKVDTGVPRAGPGLCKPSAVLFFR